MTIVLGLDSRHKELNLNPISRTEMYGLRSIGRIDLVDPTDLRNRTGRSGGLDRLVRWKTQSKSIQYGGRLSNVLTTCLCITYIRYIDVCCQNDAHCYESDVILQKSTSLIRLLSLFSKYWYSGLSAVRLYSFYFIAEQIGSLYYLARSDRSVPLQHQDRSGTFLPMERRPGLSEKRTLKTIFQCL